MDRPTPSASRPFRVALTFDAEHADAPTRRSDVTETIVERLATHAVRATFFMQGRWVESRPDVARSIAFGGHLIGNHAYHHARMPLLTDEGIASDVAEAERAIRAATGSDPRPWFRCPFGAGHDDRRILAALEGLGYHDMHWDVDGEDWVPNRRSEAIADTVVDGALAFGDGAVALLHGWPDSTVDAIGPIVNRLRGAGATFVGVDELAPIATRRSSADLVSR